MSTHLDKLSAAGPKAPLQFITELLTSMISNGFTITKLFSTDVFAVEKPADDEIAAVFIESIEKRGYSVKYLPIQQTVRGNMQAQSVEKKWDVTSSTKYAEWDKEQVQKNIELLRNFQEA
jgi:hypothetical protein